MRRTKAVLLALLVTAAVGLPAVTAPAQAHTKTCVFNHWLQTYERTLGYPTMSPPTNTYFTLLAVTPTCVVDGTALDWSGWSMGRIAGHCEAAEGYGEYEGHGYTFKWTAGTITFSGAVIGTVQAFVDPFASRNNCLDATAWHVLLTGPVTLVH